MAVCLRFGLSGFPGKPLPLLSKLCMPLEFLAEYAYSAYVLQFVCYALWPSRSQIGTAGREGQYMAHTPTHTHTHAHARALAACGS
eukprot:312963-Amphidinium_carterae.1